MASFFDVAGSIFVDRFVIYVEKRLWETWTAKRELDTLCLYIAD